MFGVDTRAIEDAKGGESLCVFLMKSLRHSSCCLASRDLVRACLLARRVPLPLLPALIRTLAVSVPFQSVIEFATPAWYAKAANDYCALLPSILYGNATDFTLFHLVLPASRSEFRVVVFRRLLSVVYSRRHCCADC
jgi:hypothetical protein